MSDDKPTVDDLINEGRRYVLHVGEHYEGDGFRATIVFEDYPFFFPTGELTNRPSAPSVVWWPTDDEDAALEMALSYSEQKLGISRTEHDEIVMSSIGAFNLGRRVSVKRAPESGDVLLRDAFDNEMRLEEDDAVAVYQGIAQSMYLPFRGNCSKCSQLLNNDHCCEDCDY